MGGREASAAQGKKEGRRVSPCIAAGRSQGLAQENNFSLRVIDGGTSLRCVGRQDRAQNARPLRGSDKNSFLARREARRSSALTNGGTHAAGKTTGENPMSNSQKPTRRAYIVRNYTDKDGAERSHWTDIGGVWPHKKGNGFDVALIALPIDG